MKKYLLLLILITVCVTFLTACGKKNEKVISLDSFFNTKASVTTNTDEYEIILSSKGGGVWQIQFISPSRISGVLHTVSAENYTVSYEYMSQEIPLDRYQKSDISYVTRVLDMCFSDIEFTKQADNTYKYTGIVNECEYEIVVDENAIPLYIDIPSVQLKAEFSDFEAVK